MSEQQSTNERAENLSTTNQAGLIENLTNDLQKLNQTVMSAVEAGVSVEFVRASRHHCGDGNWGDLMMPVVVKG